MQFFTVQIATPGTATNDRFGVLTLNSDRQTAFVRDLEIELTAVEFSLLQSLLHRPGRVLSVPALMRAAYPREHVVSEATVASHLRNLRHKLATQNNGVDLLRNVYGRGYCLDIAQTQGLG
jgi:two-component system, OmpR family, response regulator BaeR